MTHNLMPDEALIARTLRAILRADAAGLLRQLETGEPLRKRDLCAVQELEKSGSGIRLKLVSKLDAARALLALRQADGGQALEGLLTSLRDGA